MFTPSQKAVPYSGKVLSESITCENNMALMSVKMQETFYVFVMPVVDCRRHHGHSDCLYFSVLLNIFLTSEVAAYVYVVRSRRDAAVKCQVISSLCSRIFLLEARNSNKSTEQTPNIRNQYLLRTDLESESLYKCKRPDRSKTHEVCSQETRASDPPSKTAVLYKLDGGIYH